MWIIACLRTHSEVRSCSSIILPKSVLSVGNRWAMWWMDSSIPYSSNYRGDAIWATSIGKVNILIVSTHLFGSCQKYPCACMYKPTLLLLYGKAINCNYWIDDPSHPLKEVAILILQQWLCSEDISGQFFWSNHNSWATFYCSAAGPHAIINGKDVVNFASANYLGLTAHEKLLVRKSVLLNFIFPFMIMFFLRLENEWPSFLLKKKNSSGVKYLGLGKIWCWFLWSSWVLWNNWWDSISTVI
jgi:hypothetical protein